VRPARAAVVVGGVGQLFQGDLDLGRHVVERLLAAPLPRATHVEDLHFGAVAVAQLLQDLAPDTLVVTGAEVRGRAPGTFERRRVVPETLSPAARQGAIGDSVTGYVTIGLLVDVANALGALPGRTVAVEVEPVSTAPAAELSPEVTGLVDRVAARVRLEADRAPLFVTVERLRSRLVDAPPEPAPALDALGDLLAELDRVERDTRWGRTFVLRDRLRGHVAAGRTGGGMDHLDWSLWWALIEELDRLQTAEVVAGGG
jgi:Ni,Fe-hydrogenase maturation factor